MATVLAKPGETPGPTQAEAALARLREDMELVAYVASHDLLAPLRIMGYSYDTLKQKRAGQGDAEEQEALETLESEMVRGRALLQGLLEYIRIETFTFNHVRLSADDLVAAALDTLGEDARAAVTHDKLPEVMGHRGRLIRLFAQLIENAVKFRSQAPPRIHISARRTGKQWTFCIEDNGIGIEPELQEAAFRLFQRLHAEGTYPGHGIGLALAKKIAISHGGRLWVESEPEKGSRFFFTLPAVEP